MKLTKTWLSYILWGLFSVILFTDIGIAAVEIYQKADAQVTWMQIASMYAYAVVGVIVVIAIYKLIEKFILPKLGEETSVLEGVAEAFALATVLIIAVAVRLITVMSATDGLDGTTVFYDYAVNVVGNHSLDVHSNGAYIYGNLLSFLLGFLGYKPASAMAVQSVMQLITIIVAYFAVKKGLGRLMAWFCLVFMSFLPGSFMLVTECTPNSLFTLFFVVYLLCLVYLCDANNKQKIKEKFHALFYVLIGLFAAFLSFYDVIGLVTFIIGIVAIVKTKNEDAWTAVQKVWFQLVLYILSFVIGFVLMMWFIPMNGFETGPAALIQYLKDCIPSFGLNLMLLSPHKGQWDSLALFIMSGLWFVGFLRDNKDYAFPYIIMIDVMTVLVFLGVGTADFSSLSSFAWIMLSAIGISSLRRFRKNEKDIAAAEKAKRDTVARKEARERRRSAASGEKEIRLDHVNTRSGRMKDNMSAIESESSFVTDNLSKKSYGIGKRTEVPVEEMPKTIEEEKKDVTPKAEETKETVTVSMESVKSTEQEYVIIKKESTMSTDVPVASQDSLTVPKIQNQEARVAQVESKPEVKAPIPVPVESKPAYSYGSPSRRPLRMPSKSTFSPEELERIRQYTGMNITPPQQPILNNHVRRDEKIITPGQPQQEIEKPQATTLVKPIAQSETVPLVQQPATQVQNNISAEQNNKKTDVNTTMQSKPLADRQPKLIRNPLPGPKPHVARELNYDYMPKTSEMKYDIEDLKGRDYFDI